VGSYLLWDEAQRRAWLQRELQSRRPLLPRNFDFAAHAPERGGKFTPTVIDTLRSFQITSQLGCESLGAYVISQCQQASDILAVMLLQQDAGVQPMQRVVPLFETLDDLQRAEATVEALFQVSDCSVAERMCEV
jgi:phosphoenolpyruvate carboxylase